MIGEQVRTSHRDGPKQSVRESKRLLQRIISSMEDIKSNWWLYRQSCRATISPVKGDIQMWNATVFYDVCIELKFG